MAARNVLQGEHIARRSMPTEVIAPSSIAAPATVLVSGSSTPLVSVIIRSMGRASLQEALDSVARQSYAAIEVIVVNAKGEGHPALPSSCGEFALRRVDLGAPLLRSAAANAGLDAARGEYLIFLDDDDLFEPTHIATLVDTLAHHPQARIAFANTRVVSATGETLGSFNQDYVAARLWSGNFLPIHAVLFHRSLLERGCRFDEALDSYEDWDFWLQASQHTTLIHCPHAGAIYRVGLSESGMATAAPEFADRQREARLAIWRKWWPHYDIGTYDATILDLKAQIGQLEQAAAERDHLQRFNEQLQEANQELHAANQGLHAANQGLHAANDTLSATLAQRDAQLESTQQSLNQVEQHIAALLGSTSWRLTAPMRAAGRPFARYRLLVRSWRTRYAATGGPPPSLPTLLFKTARTLLREGPAGIRLRTTALQSQVQPVGPLTAKHLELPGVERLPALSTIDIARYQTFFVDVFDTAVVRTWRAPTDLFEFLAHRRNDPGFAQRRIVREARARAEFKAQRDVTLEQIYAGLPHDVKEEEVEAEVRFCVANPVFRAFYDRLITSGKTLYFVSDMYLDKGTVTRILHNCGYTRYADVFVSSEDQRLKGDGSRFAWFKTEFPGCEQQAIHIGDHPIADYAQPRTHGFSAHRLPQSAEWFASDDFIASKWPALSTRNSIGLSAILGLYRIWKSGFEAVSRPTYWRQFGFFYGGALVGSFCGEIHAQLKRQGLDVARLFFLARDGDILSRAYRELHARPEPVYTFASRRCMSFAALYSLSETDDKEQLRLFTTSIGISKPEDLTERLGYPDLADLEGDLRQQHARAEPWTDASILATLQRHRDALLAKASAERGVLLDYLRHIGFFDETDAVVIDVGWSGSIQNALHKMIARENAGEPNLHGFYLGVYADVPHKENKTGYLFDGAPAPFAPYLNLIELLTASPQDGVVRVARRDGGFEPVCARRTEQEAQRQQVSVQVQQGILEFVALARKHLGGDLGFMQPEDFLHLFSTLRSHTSEEDVAEIGSLRHAMTLGNTFDQNVLDGA